MAIKYISRISGTGVMLEDTTWQVIRRNWGARITPSPGHLNNLVHFVIPTPVMIDGDGMKAIRASVRFRTESGARIADFMVTDGDNTLLNLVDINLSSSNWTIHTENIPNNPPVSHSLVITLRLQFDGARSDDIIRLSWSGVAFDNI